ncbi:MAG: phosphoribosylanthranilate isomerase [Bacteroidota bacterium]
MIPKIKVCCIANLEEAELAIAQGAFALGLVSEMPSGPGVIAEAAIARIAAAVRGRVDTFLLTSLTDPEAIVEQHGRLQTSTIQFVDALPEGAHAELRAALPHTKLVQVIHVLDDSAIGEAWDLAPHVDGILLDSGNPNLETKQLGGTGRTHNWAVSAAVVKSLRIPVILAGGLRPDNVAAAWKAVRPYGFDLCSGLRTEGALDSGKLNQFFGEVRDLA